MYLQSWLWDVGRTQKVESSVKNLELLPSRKIDDNEIWDKGLKDDLQLSAILSFFYNCFMAVNYQIRWKMELVVVV